MPQKRSRRVPTAIDILQRAWVLLDSPLPHEWARCELELGPYCVRCATARAKTELTADMSFDDGDDELREAVAALKDACAESASVLSMEDAQDAVIEALRKLLNEAALTAICGKTA